MRIINTPTANIASHLARRLKSCCSKTRNGKAKCRITNPTPITPHPPCILLIYHVVSSGMLPGQLIRNCGKLKIPQNNTKTAHPPADQKKQSPNGREKVWIEHQHPVDHGKGHNERVNDDRRAAKS